MAAEILLVDDDPDLLKLIGIRKSVTTTAGLATAICASADSPLSAERTR